ncbi:hypothetical protein N9164_12525 [Draconibacterium sp.]|nr:hypothetical protein [Draconibacterium sp.]
MKKGDAIPTIAECVTAFGFDPTTVGGFKSYSTTTGGEFEVYDGNGDLYAVPVGSLYVCATDAATADSTAEARANLIFTIAHHDNVRWYLFSPTE